MHIYSSPRNMSVNSGSVSTKHEQHSLPNPLYSPQIWHHAHSFRLSFLFKYTNFCKLSDDVLIFRPKALRLREQNAKVPNKGYG